MKDFRGFTGTTLVYPDHVGTGDLSWENGCFCLSSDSKDGYLTLPPDFLVAPGFIDEHIHGAGGTDTMDGTIAALENIAKSLPQEGVTSFNATTMTMDENSIIKALRNVKAYRAAPHEGARLIGAHLEGPFISPKHPGAQDPSKILPCDVQTFQTFEKASGDAIRIVTFAYEENGKELLSYLRGHGITASIGHSDCLSGLLKEGLDGGISSVTHTYNAQRGFAHREVGIVGTALLDDRLHCELIADLKHVSPDAIRLLFKCKKKGSVILISDSTEGKFLAPGEYELGGQKVEIFDGVARLEDGTIAGSVLSLNKALANAAALAEGYSLSDLINCVSLNPAKNLGLDKDYGSLEQGKKADFVVMDYEFRVFLTCVGGHIVFVDPKFKAKYL